MKAIFEKNNYNLLTCIQLEGNLSTENTEEIDEALAGNFESVSSSSKYTATFRSVKSEREQNRNFTTDKLLDYNLAFRMKKLNASVSQLKKSSFGPDTNINDMLNNLTPAVRESILEVYSGIRVLSLAERSQYKAKLKTW
ncbi:hypothetical protein HHI36_004889 [Cryptolaemus montrouzieri]|uniref:Uncharacterized protein n=1 Tax=Cryptolaemus montrouzieri TaxID=559131 RepID=A0ABD2NSJ8_9CUCU